MQIHVWQNYQKRTNSTKQPNLDTATAVLEGYFRNSDPFSLYSPIVTFNNGTNVSAPRFNYCYINDFRRFYWIVDWVHSEGVWIAYLEVDLLATFKVDIGLKEMYILRSSAEFDPYIIDTKYPVTGSGTHYNDLSGMVMCQQPGATVAQLVPDLWNRTFTEGCYVINVYGPNATGLTQYIATYAGFKAFAQKLYDFDVTDTGNWDAQSIGDIYGTLTTSIPDGLAKAIADPIQFVASVYWYPLTPYTISGSSNIKLGYYNLGNISGIEFLNSTKTVAWYSTQFTLRKHPQSNRGAYVNGSPYTKYVLEVPPFVEMELDAELLIDCTHVQANWYVDYASAKGKLFLTGYSDNQTKRPFLGSVEAQFGVDINLSQNKIDIEKVFSASSLALGAAGALLNATGNAPNQGGTSVNSEGFSHNSGSFGESTNKIVSKLKDKAASAVGGFVSFNPGLAPTLQTIGGVASYLTFASNNPAKIHTSFFTICDEDNASLGRPLCKVRRPSQLGGYMIVDNPKIETFGTLQETEGVKEYLIGGFFYE